MGGKNKKGDLSSEDRDLWQRVTEGTKPISGRKARAPKAPTPAVPRTPTRRARMAEPEERDGQTPLTHGSTAGLDKRKAERLKRGKLPIEARLDLHGRHLEAAHAAVTRFLADAQADGKRCVLIVTGKGRGEGGLLRQEVPRWLNETGNRGRVVSFDYAQPKDGGAGALYVLLRRIREK